MYRIWGRGLMGESGRIVDLRTEPSQMTNLRYDETMQGTVIGFGGTGNARGRTDMVHQARFVTDSPSDEHVKTDNVKLTSLSLSPSKFLLMTALDLNSPAYCLDLSDVTSEQHVKSEIQPIFLPTRNQSLQASTANPFSDAISFAIATSNGALVLNESQGDWAIKLSALHIDSHGVTDVDWLSPNVIMKGCKDGGVRLWDIRTRGENRESRFQHPSQINYARRIDETTIVVAGHESHLCTYDLRFPSGRPYMQFPSYQNRMLGRLGAGFDVYGDLAAAVTDDSRIIIWDIKRGLKLMETERRAAAPPTCVQFIYGGQEEQVLGLGLMAGAGLTIDEFSWGGERMRWGGEGVR
ncbi:MAG: hypothetical protein ASARMPREDX12_001424 [Alectoria sarmentosa]|nr:MAG: hypothetical protein ASARMPREDX12_001424 [Alectoria sarmentosa]